MRPGAGRAELDEIRKLAELNGILVEGSANRGAVVDPHASAQGVVLEVGPLPELGLLELLDAPARAAQRRLIALDGVEDPQNLGAIARVAEAFGIDGLVLTRRRSAPLSPAAARASAGALEWLPVARVTNLSNALKALKDRGFWVMGADVQAVDSLPELPDRLFSGDLVLVFGAEGRGLGRAVQRLVDHPVRIPIPGHVESLNVSVAAAVLVYEVLRRATRASS
jgi:23S rRNA (guanosine2251-2'-O)-methyltransferase